MLKRLLTILMIALCFGAAALPGCIHVDENGDNGEEVEIEHEDD
jgi:hypothetical protein